MAAATPLDHALLLQWAFGTVVVVLYARDRFDSPACLRSTTTRARYLAARWGYVFAMLLLFMLLGGAFGDVNLKALAEVLRLGAAIEDADRLPGPLLAALVLTSMLPHVQFLSKIDTAVMKWFQRIGNIPFEVRVLSAQLQGAQFEPPTESLARIEPTLAGYGVARPWLSEAADSTRRKWSRAATLWALVDGWKGVRGYATYLQEHKDRAEEIQGRIESLAILADDARYWQSDPHDGGSAALRKTITREVERLHQMVCDFVSGGVLDREWNFAQRNAVLAAMGFRNLPGSGARLTVHEVFLVTGLLFLALTLIALVSRRFVDPTPLPQQLRLLIMVPLIYAVAIVVAVYPKSVWRFADIRLTGQRPVAAYFLSAVVAAAVAFVISLLFRFLFDVHGSLLNALSARDGFTAALKVTAERWPWLLIGAMTAFGVAWAADDFLDRPEPPWLRLAEAAGLAAWLLLAQWVVIDLLVAATGNLQWVARAPKLYLSASTAGFCIGWFVPHYYRAKLSPTPALPRATAEPAPAS